MILERGLALVLRSFSEGGCEAEAEAVISNQIEEMIIQKKIKQVRNFLNCTGVVKMVRRSHTAN